MDIKNNDVLASLPLLRPANEMSCDEWTETYRVMTSHDSPVPGSKFSFQLVPYAREICRIWSEPRIRQIVWKAGSQIGKTNTMLSCLAYECVSTGGNAMLALPSMDMVDRFSASRIDPLVEACKPFKDIKLDKWTKQIKVFKGGSLLLAPGHSSSQLSSTSCRVVMVDEAKDMPVLKNGSDSIRFVLDRTKTFRNSKKIFIASTPTTEDSPIATYFDATDSQLEYYITHPECGHEFVLDFSHIDFGEDDFPFDIDLSDKSSTEYRRAAKEHCKYLCPECGGVITDGDKARMVRAGRWLDPKTMKPLDEKATSVSFRLSTLNAIGVTFGDVVAEFLESKDERGKLFNFKTAWLAEDWVDGQVTKEADELQENMIDLPQTVVPKDAQCLTAGIDVQSNRFYATVWAWMPDRSGHLVHTTQLSSFDEVAALVHDNEYPIEGQPDRFMKIWRAAMDTGGNMHTTDSDGHQYSQTARVYSFIRAESKGKIFAIKGSGRTQQMVKQTLLDKLPNGKPMPGGLMLHTLDVNSLKEQFFYGLEQGEGEPQRLTLYSDTPKDILLHLTSEYKAENKNGTWEWKKRRTRNDYLDCSIYAMVLVDSAFKGGLRFLNGKQACVVDYASESTSNEEKRDNTTDSYMGAVKKIINQRGGTWNRRR